MAGVLMVFAAFLLSTVHHRAIATGADERSVLHLLNVVPYPNSNPSAGWDRGLELIPAGEIAAEEINNRSDVLPGGYRLKLLPVDSEACGESIVTDAVVNSYRYLVDPQTTVVGVVGLVCSSVTDIIAPIADHPNISLLEIAGSTAPRHRDRVKYPLLFHIMSSSINYNEAVIKMMEVFEWQRISLFHDSVGVYFISTASDFQRSVLQDSQLELVTHKSITIAPRMIESALTSLRQEEGRIVYAVVTESESAAILCQAYKRGYTWPGYAYIFSEGTIDSILGESKGLQDCTVEEVQEALEGVFLLDSVRSSSQDTALVSGKTYQNFYEEYKKRLMAANLGNITTTTSYANVLYDQVWAFGLALNHSLTELDIDFRFGDSHTTEILAAHLQTVSFQGASGRIHFSTRREGETPVEIYQVQNGEAVLLGIYDPHTSTFSKNLTHSYIYVPADRFDTVQVLLPTWLAVVYFTICGLCYILTTANLVVYLYWREVPHIKATSPYLSLLIFLGCYLMYTSSLMRTLNISVKSLVENETLFVAFSNLTIWLWFSGLNLIFATLLVKLLRIYHVFRYFGRTSRLWSDPFICLGSLTLCLGGFVLLTVWTITVHGGQKEVKGKYTEAEPQPYYETQALYTTKHFQYWIAGVFLYSGFILTFVTFMGIQTRKIKRTNFKDTKKVNAYVAATILVIGATLPTFFLFKALDQFLIAHVCLSSGILLIAILCQTFLFLPKTLPLVYVRNRQTVLTQCSN